MMKSPGEIKKLGELGRIVIPVDMRRALGIKEKDALEIYIDNGKIMLKKYGTDTITEDQ